MEADKDERCVLIDNDNNQPTVYRTGSLPDRPQLKKCSIVVYGQGAAASAIVATVAGFFLNPFFLEEAKIPAVATGLILLLGRVSDALTDPIVGRLSDMTRTRFGRRKPWLIASVIPCALTYSLLWQTPDVILESSTTVRTVYYTSLYFFYQLSFTSFEIPYVSLLAELSPSDKDRVSLATSRQVIYVIWSLSGTAIQSLILSCAESASCELIPTVREGYAVGGVVVGCIIAVCASIAAIGIKEPPPPLPLPRLPLWQSIQGLVSGILRNRPYVILVVVYTCTFTWIAFVQNNLVLYTAFALHNYTHFTGLIMSLLGTAMLSMPLAYIAVQRFGKRPSFLAATFVLVIGCVWLFFLPEFDIWVTYMVLIMCGPPLAIAFLVPWAMLPETIDVDEAAHGLRREGVFSAFFVFLQKLALGGASSLSNFALASAGFDSDVPLDGGRDDHMQQPDAVAWTLRVLVGLCPLVLQLLSVVAILLYPLGPDDLAANRDAIRLRREQAREAKVKAGMGRLVGDAAPVMNGSRDARESTQSDKLRGSLGL